MAKIEINKISNANIYIDGNSLLGRAAEIKLPDIAAIMSEHKALGMIGKIELPSGFEKMDGEIIWNSFYKDVFSKVADPFGTLALQCRSSVETHASSGRISETPMVTFLTVRFTKNPLGNFKQNENAEFTSSFNATYVKQVFGGSEILEIDYMANIYKVGGKDMTAKYRSNIGG